jgi:two-component system, sensor histidine kinase and response regulator
MGGEPVGPVLDVEATLTRLGGDQKLFAEMAGYALEDAPALLNELRTAVAEEDAGAVQTRAHALKGLAAGCGGVRTAQIAQALEDAGAASELDSAASLAESLQAELEQFLRALKQISESHHGDISGQF